MQKDFIEGFGRHDKTRTSSFWISMKRVHMGNIKFCLWVFLGGKFISKRGVTVKVYGGIGHNLLNSNKTINSIGHGCISLGYRF